jgi:hypothetical protein
LLCFLKAKEYNLSIVIGCVLDRLPRGKNG